MALALAVSLVASGLITSAPHSRVVQPTLKRTSPPRCMTIEPDKVKEQPKPKSQDEKPKPQGEYADYYIELPWQSYLDGDRPEASWKLGADNFVKQGRTILVQLGEKVGVVRRDPLRPPFCLGLVLSNEAVKEAEVRRESDGGRVDAHPVSRGLYDIGCFFLDNLFDGRPIQRFWFLEVIARIPYFSYVSMLHLYESFGWWRAPELRKVHSAEEWNELHHLLIMEALGGNSQWSDRFLGYHVAFLYYWGLIAVYLCSPRIAYQFMELLEAHAVDTYSTFVKENRQRLKMLPPPAVATSYYTAGDLYFFDDFQMRPPGSRRPTCDSLLDVFVNICEDESEHVMTMQACQDYALLGARVQSPHLVYRTKPDNNPDESERRKMWKMWAAQVNEKDERRAAEEAEDVGHPSQ